MRDFLPKVRVTTIVWADSDTLVDWNWETAQGDDLKNQCSTIEVNLPKILKHHRNDKEAVAKSIVEGWLSIYTVFATRQDLIDKGVRGDFSGEAEQILYRANFDAVMASPVPKRRYADLAMDEILEGKWIVGDTYQGIADKIKAALSTWRGFSSQLEDCAGKCYLCKKELIPPEPKPREWLDFVTDTPYASIQPSPFIDTIVWVCHNCQSLAKQMDLDAKPFEVKFKETK